VGMFVPRGFMKSSFIITAPNIKYSEKKPNPWEFDFLGVYNLTFMLFDFVLQIYKILNIHCPLDQSIDLLTF
jgi:hypothetical protein